MSEDFEDIINLEHPTSKRHPRMKLSDRAAQFSPFAALTGYDDAVVEAGRVTEKKRELSEEAKSILNEKMRLLLDKADEPPTVTVTYFVSDSKKEGGKYERCEGTVYSIDEYKRILKFSTGIDIPIENIVEIEGEIFC